MMDERQENVRYEEVQLGVELAFAQPQSNLLISDRVLQIIGGRQEE